MRFATIRQAAVICITGFIVAASTMAADAVRPVVGAKAADFELADLGGTKIKLSDSLKGGPVVLLVLRGYPGYQCPVCNQQVGQFLAAADKFKAKGATVLMVYPGPSKELQKHAEEFVSGKTLPKDFHLLIDPDYAFTNAYDLRWDAKNETAYPSTFVIGKDQSVLLSKISMTHGGRSSVDEVLKALP
jgi:thioredoxin-dependent peroxiredoxin